MIDTDKYEGHTEGPWELIEREGTGLFNLVMWRREEKKPVAYAYNSGKYTYEYPNAQLMADAPLLLAEVKRLRKEINQLPIDLHESLDMILEAHYPEVRESVMSMFGDAWGNNMTGYEESLMLAREGYRYPLQVLM